MTKSQKVATKGRAAALGDLAVQDASKITARDVLLVAFPEDKRLELTAAFAQVGWRTQFCDGPPMVSCPLVAAGHACDERLASDVAVVMIDPDHRLSSGQLPIAFCAGCGVSPGVIVVERDMDEVEIEGPIAIVGGTSRAEVVVAAAEALVDRESESS
jgi:hypothetical protein